METDDLKIPNSSDMQKIQPNDSGESTENHPQTSQDSEVTEEGTGNSLVCTIQSLI